MCTLSWLRRADGYDLFFNRDERKTRQPALEPSLKERGGSRWISPTDGDFGGSWIAANEFGLTICLLNRWGDPFDLEQRDFKSRGWLVNALADSTSVEHLERELKTWDPEEFPPFTLVAVEVEQPALVFEWDGTRAVLEYDGDQRLPLSSSSVQTERVLDYRNEKFSQLSSEAQLRGGITVADLESFHSRHEPEQGAFSVLMQREDAATQSISHVSVNGDWVIFDYRAVELGSLLAPTRLELEIVPTTQP